MLNQSAGIAKLQEGVNLKLEENRLRGKKMLEHKKEYSKLDEKLSTLPDKLSHDVMVPFTTKAFMPGKLIHTNELMVLLGDNYFIETSAKHAREICNRRIKQCDKVLEELQKEMELVQGWRNQTSQLQEEGQQCLDISEEMSEQQLEDWRKKHNESVKREREKARESDKESVKIQTDDDLWKRLEELEVREALEKEWEEEENDDDDDDEDEEEDDEVEDSDDEGVSDHITDDESDDDVDVNKRKLERRVSFAQDPTEKVREIRFSHSECEAEPLSTSDYPVHPGDINPHSSNHTDTKPKSILKMSDDYNPADYIRPEPEPVSIIPSEPFQDPVSSTVVESSPLSAPEAQSDRPSTESLPTDEPPKRVSRFKAMRAQR